MSLGISMDILLEKLKIQKTDNTNCWPECRTRASFLTGGDAKWHSDVGGDLAVSYKMKHNLM